VAVFAPLHSTFTYRWPAALGEPLVGLRVRVPFGRSMRHGVVVGVDSKQPEQEAKPVEDRLEVEPSLTAKNLQWLQRAARYYLASIGEMLEMALAWAGIDEKTKIRLADAEKLAELDSELSETITSRRAMTLKTCRERIENSHPIYRLLTAVSAGALEVVPEKGETKGETRGDGETPSETSEVVELRPAQKAAADAIAASFNTFRSFLLFGATGSGKTEVYLDAAEKLVAEGGQVLILVPEIGLTPMWLSRLQKRFGKIGVWHSAMAGSERLQVRSSLGDLQVLIGTRSALFLPLPRLSMIVVDEEHDGSFKQQDGVHYSARDLSLLLGQERAIPVVLGSATPSLESWRQVKEGGMTLLELPERIQAHHELKRHIIDMRRIDVGGAQKGDALLSPQLIKALKQVKAAGQQSILFLNRRGYSPALQCTACGEVPKCHACSLNLTLHRRAGELRCHACGLVRRVPRTCEVCGEDALLPLGAGMEKLEEYLAEVLPDINFARFDRDMITSNRRLKDTLAAFEQGETDCLIGTQMLVKGHHFPNVTLVGVVNADMGLSLPDFRAGERWWQQMTQVTGRAGRGDHPGRVIIQTHSPEASWFERIGDESAKAVLDDELMLRKQLNYPPYARWVRIVFSAIHQDRAEAAAMEMAGYLERWGEKLDQVAFSGPMLCPVERLAGRYRVEILLRDNSRKVLPWKLAPLLEKIPVPSGVRRKVDVDPMDMM